MAPIGVNKRTAPPPSLRKMAALRWSVMLTTSPSHRSASPLASALRVTEDPGSMRRSLMVAWKALVAEVTRSRIQPSSTAGLVPELRNSKNSTFVSSRLPAGIKAVKWRSSGPAISVVSGSGCPGVAHGLSVGVSKSMKLRHWMADTSPRSACEELEASGSCSTTVPSTSACSSSKMRPRSLGASTKPVAFGVHQVSARTNHERPSASTSRQRLALVSALPTFMTSIHVPAGVPSGQLGMISIIRKTLPSVHAGQIGLISPGVGQALRSQPGPTPRFRPSGPAPAWLLLARMSDSSSGTSSQPTSSTARPSGVTKATMSSLVPSRARSAPSETRATSPGASEVEVASGRWPAAMVMERPGATKPQPSRSTASSSWLMSSIHAPLGHAASSSPFTSGISSEKRSSGASSGALPLVPGVGVAVGIHGEVGSLSRTRLTSMVGAVNQWAVSTSAPVASTKRSTSVKFHNRWSPVM